MYVSFYIWRVLALLDWGWQVILHTFVLNIQRADSKKTTKAKVTKLLNWEVTHVSLNSFPLFFFFAFKSPVSHFWEPQTITLFIACSTCCINRSPHISSTVLFSARGSSRVVRGLNWWVCWSDSEIISVIWLWTRGSTGAVQGHHAAKNVSIWSSFVSESWVLNNNDRY